MTEEEFTKTFVMPLLRKIGYQKIRYVHGVDECGRDVIFFDKDKLGFAVACACQVKIGDPKGTQKKKIQTEIVPQLLEGLRTEIRDPESGERFRVNRMYLFLSGRLVGTAKDQIYSLTSSEPNINVLDIQSIDVLSGGEGYDTLFMLQKRGSPYSYPAGLKFRPRLPLLSKGMSLSIGMNLGEGMYCDYIEISDVTFDPLLREQGVTIYLPVNGKNEPSQEILDSAAAELDKYFFEQGIFLQEIIEDGI